MRDGAKEILNSAEEEEEEEVEADMRRKGRRLRGKRRKEGLQRRYEGVRVKKPDEAMGVLGVEESSERGF